MADDMDIRLPEAFAERMKNMLGEEYPDFLKTFQDKNACSGIRINKLKKNAREAVIKETGELPAILWCPDGFYTDKNVISGKHPYHIGGLVYFQEPSAMLPVEALGIREGDFVLDLCASPGGKSTQAAAKLSGSGLLVANEIVPKRASILCENIQRMGIKNAVVTNESPDRLADKYRSFFDKIIVDAPCSGEGMFKKEPQAIWEWSEEHTYSCAERQKNILRSAFAMLKGGGYLVYSTCTFAPCENEEIAAWVLSEFPEVELVPIEVTGVSEGKTEWSKSNYDMSVTKRIFPHKSRGEGHFAALFKKNGSEEQDYKKAYKCEKESLFRDFEKEYLNTTLEGTFIDFGDKLFLMPYNLDIDKIKTELPGLFLGVCKKGRFEPSHALCLALAAEDFKNTTPTEEPERFFRGETIVGEQKGWTAVLYRGYPIGWGKGSEGMIKNHFPKYLRI